MIFGRHAAGLVQLKNRRLVLAAIPAAFSNSGLWKCEMSQFVTDIKNIRQQARKHMEQGAVTESYKADRNAVVKVLNEVLATELVCVLRYKHHYFMAAGIDTEAVKAEFLQHANEEQQHSAWVANHITQLNGQPNLNPAGLATRSHSEYQEGGSLVDLSREDLYAERIAIESYSSVVRWLGNDDPTMRS